MLNYSRIVRNTDGVYVGSTADWTAENAVLPLGAIGVDKTTGTVKIGDGTTAWGSLSVIGSGGGGGAGSLLAANNLSDLASAAAARANLGLGASATAAAKYPAAYEEWLLNGSPAGTFRSNFPRRHAASAVNVLTSGVMVSVALYLEIGDVVTNLTFKGVAAASAPTNWWFALYDTQATPALIAQTADQGSAAWAANTTKTLPLSSPYTATTSGIHYAAAMMAATTPSTLVGMSSLLGSTTASSFIAGQKSLVQSSGSGLTTTAPATITGASAVANIPYVVAN